MFRLFFQKFNRLLAVAGDLHLDAGRGQQLFADFPVSISSVLISISWKLEDFIIFSHMRI